jgi:hypothetical protein
MQDDTAMKDIKTTFSTYQGAIVKYCEELQRKSPFIKDAIRCLQEGIKEDMENAKSKNTGVCSMLIYILSSDGLFSCLKRHKILLVVSP